VRFLSGARQKAYLPCVFSRPHGKEKTHGKQALCRASDKKRTANKIFAVRFSSSARQSIFSPYTHRVNHVSFFQKYFAVRFNFGARQTHVFAVRFCYSARQSIFLPIFPKSKIQLLLKNSPHL
jgi:hypothetical protein